MTETKRGWVWHEVMSTDVSKASEYYRSLFGWGAEEMKMGELGDYLMFKLGEMPVAGMAAAEPNLPSYWLGYVMVDDVTATEAKVKELGGTILAPVFDIPNIGKACIAQDPEGAVFAPFQGNQAEPAPQGPPPDGSVCWNELMAKDDAKMAEFYTALLGWTASPMGPGSTLLKEGERMVGTIRKKEGAALQAPSHWMVYFSVASVDEALTKHGDLGGATIMGKSEVPNMGEFAVVSDPAGGVYAFWHQTAPPPQ
ncbi:MAG: VOC family protein [Myxococcota bacterium]